MAQRSTTTGKEKLTDEEEILQAVILADSFNKRFTPLTKRRPRCLLPICNAPLLDWTFESLSLAGVQEIFVVCRSHAELVKEAIKKSKWAQPSSGIKIIPIMTVKETFSVGDAMRDIYTHGIITSDFILVSGDLVSNVRIDEVVRLHKERRKANKDIIMTMIVKESGVTHRTRSRGDSSVFVLDAGTSECLYYERIVGYPPASHIRIPREILAEHPEVEIRNDLIDCSIDICSVEVPSLFQDNFDYLDMRRDFVHGILTSDLLMKNIYCHVVKEGYAARVQDTRTYDSISKDILSRWTFPLVPDDNNPAGQVYEHLRGNRYIAKDSNVILSRTCKIGKNTLIGSDSQVLDNTQIIASVIGPRCVIGPNTVVRNSYIFEGSTIGPNCIVESSIIGTNVTVKETSSVDKGCLVGDDVVLGPEALLPSFSKVSVKKGPHDLDEEDDDELDLENIERNQQIITGALGKDSNAVLWLAKSVESEETELDPIDHPINQRLMRIGDSASDLDLSDAGSVTDSEEESESEEEDALFRPSLGALSDSSSVSLPTSELPSATAAAEAEFRTEVAQSLSRAFAEGHSVDNASVELKTLRMASNVPLTWVHEAVVKGIVDQIPIVSGVVPQRKEISAVIGRWGELISRIGGSNSIEIISMLQKHCAGSDRLPLFGQILAAFYQDDIVEEDDIRAWHSLSTSTGAETKSEALADNMRKCWTVGARMIAQFDEQDSESEGDTVDNSVAGSVAASVDDSVSASVDDSVTASVDDSFSASVHDSIAASVDDGVTASVDDNVAASVNGSVAASADDSGDSSVNESDDDSANDSGDTSAKNSVHNGAHGSTDDSANRAVEKISHSVESSVNSSVASSSNSSAASSAKDSDEDDNEGSNEDGSDEESE